MNLNREFAKWCLETLKIDELDNNSKISRVSPYDISNDIYAYAKKIDNINQFTIEFKTLDEIYNIFIKETNFAPLNTKINVDIGWEYRIDPKINEKL